MFKLALRVLIKYIFSDFSNKMTKMVVVFGLLLMAPTLLTIIFGAIVDQYFNKEMKGDNHLMFGLCLVISGLVHNLLYQFIKKSKFVNKLNPAYINDQMLFNEFIKLVPSSPVIENLRWADFYAEVERVKYEPLRMFMHRWDNAEHIFNDLEIEKGRSNIMILTNKFFELIGAYTVPVGYNSEYASVQDKNSERSQEFECRNKEQADEIHEILESLILAHQKFITLGKKMYLLESRKIKE